MLKRKFGVVTSRGLNFPYYNHREKETHCKIIAACKSNNIIHPFWKCGILKGELFRLIIRNYANKQLWKKFRVDLFLPIGEHRIFRRDKFRGYAKDQEIDRH